MAGNILCGDCGGIMQEGFVIDYAHYNSMQLPYWVQGRPERSFWTNAFKTSAREKYNIKVYRCERCGLLKSYAEPGDSDDELPGDI